MPELLKLVKDIITWGFIIGGAYLAASIVEAIIR